MKELSIEEKAKRYDSMFERLKEMYNNNKTNVAARLIYERYFPELKESEDEEIRKRLLEYFEGFKMGKTNVKWEGLNVKDIIAWLEKQGENDRNMKFVTDDAYQRGYDEGIKVTLEKKCEQKPVPDWMPKFLDELRLKKNYFDWEEHKDIEGGILAIIKWMNPNYFNGKDGEQKPAWSEEDEMIYQHCLTILHDYGYDTWFKSIKDRVQPQPRQEWSEEDEYNQAWIVEMLYGLEDEDKEYEKKCRKMAEWLKSLRPQNSITDEELSQAKKDAYNDALDKIEYHSGEPTFDDGWSAAIGYIQKKSLRPKLQWKPSEKQIISLYNSIPNAAFCERETLTQLYVDLKKLKE